MRLVLAVGRQGLELEVADANLIASRPSPPLLPDAAAAVEAALEAPFGFPPLRRSLTPDDRLAVVVEGPLPGLVDLLVPVLDHAVRAGVSPGAITLVCSHGADTEWVNDLPDHLEEVVVEPHDPADQRRLAYLATTAGGKRLYLNRTVVEADQALVLTARRYDLLLGHAGAEGALYPNLADQQAQQEVAGRLNLDVPGEAPWPTRREAVEVTWLLGQPFFIQAIPGPGDTVARVVAGATEACAEGARLLDALWRQEVPRPADVVIATLGGDPAGHTFADLAAAAACAARVVKPQGRIVLLSRAAPPLGAAGEALLRHDDARSALAALGRRPALELGPALQWARAAEQARLSLLSGLPPDTVEELFATPLAGPAEAQRLLAGQSCLVLEDAHKALAVLK